MNKKELLAYIVKELVFFIRRSETERGLGGLRKTEDVRKRQAFPGIRHLTTKRYVMTEKNQTYGKGRGGKNVEGVKGLLLFVLCLYIKGRRGDAVFWLNY